MTRASRFFPEVRDRAVRMVLEHAEEYPSQWAAMSSIAQKLGCTAETLRHWVRQAGRESRIRAPQSLERGGFHLLRCATAQ